jgi:hypothetical protein
MGYKTGEAVNSKVELWEKPQRRSSGESRRFPRFQFRHPLLATIYPPRGMGAQPRPSEIMGYDLSRGGMSLIHTEELFQGQRIAIELGDKNRMLEVRWCHRISPKSYMAGCCFVKQRW